jgi:hypothetical protein
MADYFNAQVEEVDYTLLLHGLRLPGDSSWLRCFHYGNEDTGVDAPRLVVEFFRVAEALPGQVANDVCLEIQHEASFSQLVLVTTMPSSRYFLPRPVCPYSF